MNVPTQDDRENVGDALHRLVSRLALADLEARIDEHAVAGDCGCVDEAVAAPRDRDVCVPELSVPAQAICLAAELELVAEDGGRGDVLRHDAALSRVLKNPSCSGCSSSHSRA